MKNNLLVLISFCFSMVLSAQEKIFYKVENDTIVSVVDEDGKIIVKPFKTAFTYYDKEEITKDFFYIYSSGKHGVYAVDRKGKFLFYPYFFDNGPDYFNENFTRITDTSGKVGMANQYGEITIKPQYDFLSQFQFGYAFYCNGCYFDRKIDPEHPPLVNTENGGYIDYYGKEIPLQTKKNHPKDTEIKEGKFIPYQFSYSGKEKLILGKFDEKKIREKLKIDDSYAISFEITGRPSTKNNFYSIKLYQKYDKKFYSDFDDEEFRNFRVSGDGNKILVLTKNWIESQTSEGEPMVTIHENWIPIDDWLMDK